MDVLNTIFAVLAAKGDKRDQLMIDVTHLKARLYPGRATDRHPRVPAGQVFGAACRNTGSSPQAVAIALTRSSEAMSASQRLAL